MEERLKKILETEYGIKSEKDLDQAIEQSKGIDIGIFLGRKEKDENS